MKKTLGVVLACALAASSAFAQSLSFSNEVSLDPVLIQKDSATFNDLSDEVVIDFASEKVEAGVDVTFSLTKNLDGVVNGIDYTDVDVDWYAVFKPVDMVTLALSKSYNVAGSYFYVEDDNMVGGNMGSEGFTVLFTGVPGLTLASSVPFANSFEKFDIRFGAEYNINDVVSLGATVQDAFDSEEINFGVYAAVAPVEGFSFNVGYSYNDGIRVVNGSNIFNFSASYGVEDFTVAVDYATSSTFCYAGVNFDVSVTDVVGLSLCGTIDADYEGNYIMGVAPKATFAINENNEFSVKVSTEFTSAGDYAISFPLSWTYSF